MNIVITGASTGIGRELALLYSKQKHKLVLVARNATNLEKVATECSQLGAATICIPLDLSLENGGTQLYKTIKAQNLDIDLLINNAGFGYVGAFEKAQLQQINGMINTNIASLTQLCYHFAQQMSVFNKGTIVNIASTAAFSPGPFMAVYYASKSYVLNLSLALHAEFKKQGIHVLTYCPGPTQSEFAKTAGFLNTESANSNLPTAAQVAKDIQKVIGQNKMLHIHGSKNRQEIFMLRFRSIKKTIKKVYKGLKPSSKTP